MAPFVVLHPIVVSKQKKATNRETEEAKTMGLFARRTVFLLAASLFLSFLFLFKMFGTAASTNTTESCQKTASTVDASPIVSSATGVSPRLECLSPFWCATFLSIPATASAEMVSAFEKTEKARFMTGISSSGMQK